MVFPALYTYLGQFIDHDITFDPAAVCSNKTTRTAWSTSAPRNSTSTTSTAAAPTTSPTCTTSPAARGKPSSCSASLLSGGGLPNSQARDLPRNDSHVAPHQPARAIIGDPRNDENALVSQLQGLFLRFHNRLIDEASSASPRRSARCAITINGCSFTTSW